MSSKQDHLSKYYGDGGELQRRTIPKNTRGKKKRSRDKKRRALEHGVVVHENETDDLIVGECDVTIESDQGESNNAPVIVKSDELPEFDPSFFKVSASVVRSRGEMAPDRTNKTLARGVRYDSDDDDSDSLKGVDKSNDSAHYKRKERFDSSDESTDGNDENRVGNDPGPGTLSGRKAGLQSSQAFAELEGKIQQEQRAQTAAAVDEHGMGETIYRTGSEGRRQVKRNVLSKEQRWKLNTGTIQKAQQRQGRAHLEKIKQSTFARGKDDAEIEEVQRSAVREGDPMVKSTTNRKESNENISPRQRRPLYQGPAAKPNRFGILPGFRWDGNDRGNGFEDRLLAKQAHAAQLREDAYRSNADGM